MRWLIVGSLLSDSRVAWLLCLVIIAIIAAIILIYYELKHKKEDKVVQEIKQENKLVTDFKKSLIMSRTNQERLNVIDHYCKTFFKDKFNIHKTESYSNLVKIFTEKQFPKFADFSQQMLKAYYSPQAIDKQQISFLANQLMFLMKKMTIPSNMISLQDMHKEKQEHSDIKKQIEKQEEQFNYQFLPKDLKLKEKELLEKEKENLKAIKELEKKLAMQTQRKEKLEKRVETKAQLQEKIIEEEMRKELLEKEKEKSKTWNQEIEEHPKIGKHWLKELRKKKRGNFI